jgi:hypothetical protein
MYVLPGRTNAVACSAECGAGSSIGFLVCGVRYTDADAAIGVGNWLPADLEPAFDRSIKACASASTPSFRRRRKRTT